jgi:adenosine deaminase
MADVVAAGRRNLDAAEARWRALLRCGTLQADPGCDIEVRYVYMVIRSLPPEAAFGQMVYGFELAQADPRVVAVNIVSPEAGYVSRRDYRLHMAMFEFLQRLSPTGHLSLHAGELTRQLVPPEGLRFHIREAIKSGYAQRIGHGVSILYEDDAAGLLEVMARRQILVEISLASNDAILGIRGRQHPLRLYRQAGVPVALVTDDEGILRSDLTHEYQRAVEEHGLHYLDLKELARNSLEYSFLPGAGLWQSRAALVPVAACAGDALGTAAPAAACLTWLQSNARAQAQWRLEAAFVAFEQGW